MISKISMYFFLPMCILAFFLALAGVRQIQFGNDYYIFLRSVSVSYQSWHFEIPRIPNVPLISRTSLNSNGLLLGVLIAIGNFFVAAFNGVIGTFNVLITILNVIITVIQFILTLIYQCKDFITRLTNVRIAYV